MPIRTIHNDTGFIEFNKTDTEISIDELSEENKELKSKLAELEDKITALANSSK